MYTIQFCHFGIGPSQFLGSGDGDKKMTTPSFRSLSLSTFDYLQFICYFPLKDVVRGSCWVSQLDIHAQFNYCPRIVYSVQFSYYCFDTPWDFVMNIPNYPYLHKLLDYYFCHAILMFSLLWLIVLAVVKYANNIPRQ